MTYTVVTPAAFLAQIEPFDRISAKNRTKLAKIAQYYRYHVGQPIALQDRFSAQIDIVVEGTVRLLGYPGENTAPITLERLEIGSTIGVISEIRGVPCESAIASTEVICLTIPTELFMEIVEKEPILKQHLADRSHLIEIFELLRIELARHPNPDRLLQLAAADSLKDLAIAARDSAIVCTSREIPTAKRDWHWFVASQPPNSPHEIGDRIEQNPAQTNQRL